MEKNRSEVQMKKEMIKKWGHLHNQEWIAPTNLDNGRNFSTMNSKE